MVGHRLFVRSLAGAVMVWTVFLTGVASSTTRVSLRFAVVDRATIILAGNTLGVSSETSANGPGTADSTHTFLTLNQSLVDNLPVNPSNPWPFGTTNDWTLNSSSSMLTIPSGASVLYAELVWGGSFRYFEDVSAYIDGDVQFSTPLSSYPVSPDPSTAVTIDETSSSGFPATYYTRSADVTALVAAGGSGLYSVGAVPGTQHESINSLNAVGWTLAVVVREENLACRSAALAVGGSWVDEDSYQEAVFGNLNTPANGEVTGRVLVGAIEGDADVTGDRTAIQDPSSSSFLDLSGPNNPVANFFASQVNTHLGVLDTSGTWGTTNHDAPAGLNVVGGRQGWDQTGIELSTSSGTLGNDQSSTVVRCFTTGDSYAPTFFGFEADAKPDLCVEPIFTDDFELGNVSRWSLVVP